MQVKYLIHLLQKAPENDTIFAEMDNEEESAEILDVLIGNGTLKGFSFLKIGTFEE